MCASRVLGRLEEFDSTQEDISTYLERLQLYFDANGIAEDKKVSVLLTVMGPKTYGTLRSLLAPSLPKDKTFDELLTALKGHYEPKPLVISERFHFYRRSQKETETIAEFVADLRRLSIKCEFGEFLDQALRDRFVCGVRSDTIQRELLTKKDLTISRAQEIAQGMESAEKNAKTIKKDNPSDGLQFVGLTKPCYRCGRKHHERDCKFREATCHKCGKQGHIAPVCRSRSKPSHNPPPTTRGRRPPRHQRRSKSTNSTTWMTTRDDLSHNDDEANYGLFSVNAAPQPPIAVEMKLDEKPVCFELDTGATVSIMSETNFARLFPEKQIQESGLELKTYTGEQMKIVGEAHFIVSYEDQSPQELPLVVVAGKGPTLLGRNWLNYFRLNWESIKSVLLTADSLSSILNENQEVFADELGTIKSHKAKLSVSAEATPRFHRPRSVPYALKSAVEKELDRLESMGVLEHVDFSEWAAPIVVVPKKDGKVRICGDYKVTINPFLDVDQYPLPRPEDLFATLAGGTCFSTLDLSHAYNQLVLEEDSRKFLTINTHRGLYQYTRLPFGVASAPAVFQKTMDMILQGMEGVICYIDDILISGKTKEEHLGRLQKVLKCLNERGIRVKKSKCTFMKRSVQYLGHRIDATGLHATDDKLKAITEAPSPKNIQELRSFLGLINYYGRFIPNLSSLLHPLNQLLKRESPWRWSKECEQAFKTAKSKLITPNVLVHYDSSLPLRLAGDASAYGVGAVISHVMKDGTERPIAFASRTLLPSERNYSQIEKEALSLIFGVVKFHTYLYGRRFTLVTDHKPLTTILGPKRGIPPMAAARLQRWAIKLSAYTYDIKFRSTSEHSNVDGLSRLPLNHVGTEGYSLEPALFNICQLESLPVTATQLATATRKDSTLSKVLRYTLKGWPSEVPPDVSPFFSRRDELTVENGCILWGSRVLIPEKLRERMLKELHRDHPGICKMKGIARSYLWWPGLDKNIEELVKSCTQCQSVKKAPPVAPLHPWLWPTRVFQRVHIDYAGPFQGNMFFVAVDAYSKWPEVFVMQSTTVTNTIQALRHMFARYGLPEQIVSDNGPQFTSEEFAVFLKMNGVKHTRSSPYHPSTNGLAERFVQSLKQGLKASLSSGLSLSHRLCNFLLTYRTSQHATTGVSPCSLFLKREVRTRFDLLRPDADANVARKQAQQKLDHDQHARSRRFEIGQRVMAKNFRPGVDWVPATVVDSLGPLSYLVETTDGILWRRHVDHLKECLSKQPVASSNSDVWKPSEPETNEEQSDSTNDQGTNDQGSTSPPVHSETDASTTNPDQSVKTYPSRDRAKPDYYRPGVKLVTLV